MGACGSKKRDKKPQILYLSPQTLNNFGRKCKLKLLKPLLVNKIELDLLRLIYMDLASRDKTLKLTKEAFVSFFNMIGLWGDKVFEFFDRMHEKLIALDEFISGIEHYIKSSEEEKIIHLFQLYDLDNANGIRKEDFLQMLYNYPKEEIKKILDDQQFLEDQDILNAYEKQDKRRNRRIKPRKSSEDVQEQCNCFLQQIQQNYAFLRNLHLIRTLLETQRRVSPLPNNPAKILRILVCRVLLCYSPV